MSNRYELMKAAWEKVGTQAKLAAAIGCSQQNISLIANGAPLSADLAIAIDKATGGFVSVYDLRPDLKETLKRPRGKRQSEAA